MLTNRMVDDSTFGIDMAGIYFLMAGWTAKGGLVMKSSMYQDSMVGADVEVNGCLRGNQAVNGVLYDGRFNGPGRRAGERVLEGLFDSRGDSTVEGNSRGTTL